MSITKQSPKEIDLKLAEISNAIYATEDRLAPHEISMLRLAGADFYYVRKQRVTDMSIEQAVEILAGYAELVAEYKSTHVKHYGDSDDYVGTDWSDWREQNMPIAAHDADRPAEYLAKRDELLDKLDELTAQYIELETLYTGWTRFFLVTSSTGHVHSSTCCHTCRPTTRYGWLPQLSGKSESDAVAELGPTLCSVCFASAPLDWTTGKKITAAQAAKKAA